MACPPGESVEPSPAEHGGCRGFAAPCWNDVRESAREAASAVLVEEDADREWSAELRHSPRSAPSASSSALTNSEKRIRTLSSRRPGERR